MRRDSIWNTAHPMVNPFAKLNNITKGITGNWINAALKNYVVKQTSARYVNELLPLIITIDSKVAYATYRAEEKSDEQKFKSKTANSYVYGNLKFKLENDSTMSANINGRYQTFLRCKKDENNLPDLTAELNSHVIDYSRLKKMIRYTSNQQPDTLAIKCAKSKYSNEIFCCSKEKNFKYMLSYSYPVIFDYTINHSKYYADITIGNFYKKDYRIQFDPYKFSFFDLKNDKLAYIMTY